jgi:lysozyme
MAPLLILIGAGAILLLIAQQSGVVDVGSAIADLSDTASDAVTNVGATLGLVDDPVAVALPILRNFEGFSAKAYPDPPGQSATWSIGYGHQIRPGDPYDRDSEIDRDEGDRLLAQDASSAYGCVNDHVQVELSVQQTAALISFAYNVGCGAFAGSTMLSLINGGDLDAAADQFAKWIHAGGQVSSALEARRQSEADLFNS